MFSTRLTAPLTHKARTIISAPILNSSWTASTQRFHTTLIQKKKNNTSYQYNNPHTSNHLTVNKPPSQPLTQSYLSKSTINTITKFAFTTTTTHYYNTTTSPTPSDSTSQAITTTTTTKPRMDAAHRQEFLHSHLKITHDHANSRFVIPADELNALYPDDPARRTDEEAKLVYVLSDDDQPTKSIDFVTTYCPPPFRGGTGISEYIVNNGLTWATEEGYEIKAQCWYVAKFLPFKLPHQESKL